MGELRSHCSWRYRKPFREAVNFDPFNKSLEQVVAPDLERLRDVTEGWHVEYKRAPIRARDVGKSLSAFANHLGGWLTFGVAAPDRMPTAFPGLDAAEIREVMNSLRAAARDHVNPTLPFESREVVGPCDPIGLTADRSVVVVRIQQGHNPPYLHSSGRIYRRIADASEPRPETDRHVVDQFTQRAREYRETFGKLIETKPEFSKGESDLPVLQVLLTTDPWSHRSIARILKHREFAEIMARKDDAELAIALESTFPAGFGFTARHVAGNDPFHMSYTWQFSYRGFSSVVVPLRTLDGSAAQYYKYINDFFSVLPDSLASRTIDASVLWAFLTSVVAKHEALARAIGLDGDIFVKFRFLNVWRRVPYIDSRAFVDHVRANGIPVIQRAEQMVPPGTSPDDMLEISQADVATTQPLSGAMARAGGVMGILLGAIGVPDTVIFDSAEPGGSWGVIQRAISLHSGRKST